MSEEDFYKSETAFSSDTDMWATPQDLFDTYNSIFSFNTDVCASESNAKCEHYFDEEIDGLTQPWLGSCWMNPPYGDPIHPCKSDGRGGHNCNKKLCVTRGYHDDRYVPGIIDWMRKAYDESLLRGTVIVCLVPARTDTKWWHEYAKKGSVEFIKGRLKFGNSKNSAPFPSAVVTFN